MSQINRFKFNYESKQTGGSLEDDAVYKQKYLKYKQKYLQFKALKGGIINEKGSDPCNNKTYPVFSFQEKQVVKYPALFGNSLGESLYKLFDNQPNCNQEKPIDLEKLLNSLSIEDTFNALVELLNNYENVKASQDKFHHFNQLLVSLIIKYLKNIDDHLEIVVNTLILNSIFETLQKIKKIINVNTGGWCVIIKDKLKCGDKVVPDNLDTLLNDAFLKFLKNMLPKLKNDDKSKSLYKKLNINDKNKENFSCLCVQIIKEYFIKHSNYNIPLLEFVVEKEADINNKETDGRENNLFSKIAFKIINQLNDSALINIIKEVLNIDKYKSISTDYIKYKQTIEDIIAKIFKDTTIKDEDKKKCILEELIRQKIPDIITPVSQLIIEILETIKSNQSKFPQIIYFLNKTYEKYNSNIDFQKRFFYNMYFLRFFCVKITTQIMKNNLGVLISSVIQRIIANITQNSVTTASKITMLFDYEILKKYMSEIYDNKYKIEYNNDVFDETKAVQCTFSNLELLL